MIVRSDGYFLRKKIRDGWDLKFNTARLLVRFLSRGPQQPNTALSSTPMENLKEREKMPLLVLLARFLTSKLSNNCYSFITGKAGKKRTISFLYAHRPQDHKEIRTVTSQ